MSYRQRKIRILLAAATLAVAVTGATVPAATGQEPVRTVAVAAAPATAIPGFLIQTSAKTGDDSAVSKPGFDTTGWYPVGTPVDRLRRAAGERQVRRPVLLDEHEERAGRGLPGPVVVPHRPHHHRPHPADLPRLQRRAVEGRRLGQRDAGRRQDAGHRRLHAPRPRHHRAGAGRHQQHRVQGLPERPEQGPDDGLDRLGADPAGPEHGHRAGRPRAPQRAGGAARRPRRHQAAVARPRRSDGEGRRPQRLRRRGHHDGRPARSPGAPSARRSRWRPRRRRPSRSR